MTRLLVVLPYWNGDRLAMERVARLITDLLKEKTQQAELLFLGRFDADYPSPEILAHTRTKFRKVHYWRCNRGGTGFPTGCNELAYGLFRYVADCRRTGMAFSETNFLFMLEADCVVTRRTWIEELCSAWESAYANGKHVVGAYQSDKRWFGDVGAHYNAVGLYDSEMFSLIPTICDGPPDLGWDYHHRNSIMPMAVDSKLFVLDYQRTTISAEDLFRDPQVLVYHGVKDASAADHVWEREIPTEEQS